MRNRSTVIFFLLLSSYHLNGSCDDGSNSKFYVKTNLAYGISNKFNYDDYNEKRVKSWAGNIAAGKAINKNWDIDLGLYIANKQKFSSNIEGAVVTQKFRSKSLILSATYNFDTNFPIKPFISIGAGASRNTAGDFINGVNGTHNKRARTQFAYTASTGIKYSRDNYEISLEYRHLNLGRFSTSSVVKNVEGSYPGEIFYDTPVKQKIKYNMIGVGFKILF